MRQMVVQAPAQLSAHLKSLRRSRGLTQAELGTLVGLDQSRIAKIERHPEVVSMAQLMGLLAALRVRVLFEPLANEPPPQAPADW